MSGIRIKAAIHGAIVSVVLLLMMIGSLSSLLITGRIGEVSAEIAVSVVVGFCAACGSYVGGKLANMSRAVNGMLSAMIMLLAVFAMALFLDGELNYIMMRVISIAIGMLCACTILINRIGKSKKEKKHYR